MPSTLTWLDHDPAARERSLRILALFRVRDSRDELGLGAIRDSFSDKLFPGTSIIQTRLRYMLFVPWVYRELEAKEVSADRFAVRARRLELEVIEPLLDSDDRAGVFGIGAGKALKRLPSDVYWSGLGAWRIRHYQGSLDEYHRGIDRIYALRGRWREHEGDDDAVPPASVTWHSHLPEPPEDFPYSLSFALTREEAEFLRDAIVTSCPATLLAWLAREGRAGRANLPWEHPDFARFPGRDRALLQLSALLIGGARRGHRVQLGVGDRTPVQAPIGRLLAGGEETIGVEVEPWARSEHAIDLQVRMTSYSMGSGRSASQRVRREVRSTEGFKVQVHRERLVRRRRSSSYRPPSLWKKSNKSGSSTRSKVFSTASSRSTTSTGLH